MQIYFLLSEANFWQNDTETIGLGCLIQARVFEITLSDILLPSPTFPRGRHIGGKEMYSSVRWIFPFLRLVSFFGFILVA